MSQHPRAKLRNDGSDFTPTTRSDTYDFIDPARFNLERKAVFITGASKGCGRQTALSFARAGASFIGLGARSPMEDLVEEIKLHAQQHERPPPTVLALKLDVASEVDVEAARKAVVETFGRLDILINNAGYLSPFADIHESQPDLWWRGLEVNVKGPYLVTRAFLPLMLECNGYKTILNVTSVGANTLYRGPSGYQLAKLALLRFGEILNSDYAEHGVLSFAVHPGAVATELSLSMPDYNHPYLNDTAFLAADTMVWLTAERREWLAGRYVSATWDMEELVSKRKIVEEDDLLKVRMDVGLE